VRWYHHIASLMATRGLPEPSWTNCALRGWYESCFLAGCITRVAGITDDDFTRPPPSAVFSVQISVRGIQKLLNH
jgi:hypothetical protein